jgi:two-component system response regulator YesN
MIILLADDDKYVRFSLKSMLHDIIREECIIIEAKDGKALVEQCRMHRPDIAFVDINMPLLDGITGIAYCKKDSPETQFVVLTGHSDFHYAQKCVSLGISEYVLKPIDFEHLKLILNKLTSDLAHTLSFINSDFQVKLINYFELLDEIGGSSDEISNINREFQLNPGMSGTFYGFVFYVDFYNNPASYAIYRELRKEINTMGAQLLRKKQRYAILNAEEGVLRAVFLSKKDDFPKLLNGMQRLCQDRSRVDINVSCMYTQERDLYNLYRNLNTLEENHFLRIGKPAASVFTVDEGSFSRPDRDFLRQIKDLVNAYLDINEASYTKIINNLYRSYLNKAPGVDLKIVSTHIYILTGNSVDWSGYKAFCRSLVDMGQNMYANTNIPASSIDKIELIKAYIDKNYMADIGINFLAEKFELTPNYLSKLFHDKTGTKFVDYVTNIRIANAKRLLVQNRTALIKDIALMVGYFSARHFSNVFRKIVGVYPAEFREMS